MEQECARIYINTEDRNQLSVKCFYCCSVFKVKCFKRFAKHIQSRHSDLEKAYKKAKKHWYKNENININSALVIKSENDIKSETLDDDEGEEEQNEFIAEMEFAELENELEEMDKVSEIVQQQEKLQEIHDTEETEYTDDLIEKVDDVEIAEEAQPLVDFKVEIVEQVHFQFYLNIIKVLIWKILKASDSEDEGIKKILEQLQDDPNNSNINSTEQPQVEELICEETDQNSKEVETPPEVAPRINALEAYNKAPKISNINNIPENRRDFQSKLIEYQAVRDAGEKVCLFLLNS